MSQVLTRHHILSRSPTQYSFIPSKFFSSFKVYEMVPEVIVPEAEDKLFLAERIRSLADLPHDISETSLIVSLPFNRMGKLDLLREEMKNLNEKFVKMESSNTEILISNKELKSSNMELLISNRELKSSNNNLLKSNTLLTKRVEFFIKLSTEQLTINLAVLITEFTRLVQKVLDRKLFSSGQTFKDQPHLSFLNAKLDGLRDSEAFQKMRKFRNDVARPSVDCDATSIKNSLHELHENAHLLSPGYREILECIDECFQCLLGIEEELMTIE